MFHIHIGRQFIFNHCVSLTTAMVAIQYVDLGVFIGIVPTWITYQLKAQEWELGEYLELVS